MLTNAGRLFASLALLLLVYAAKSQNEKGCITFIDGGDDFVVLRINIVQKDSVVKTIDMYKENYTSTMDTLPIGIYDLKIYRDEELDLTLYNIKIEEAKTFCQTITFPDGYYRSNKKDISDSTRYEAGVYMGFGTKTIETDPKYPVNGSYAAGMSGTLFSALTRNYALGFLYGTTASLSTFDKSKPLKPYIPYSGERYFYWNFNVGLVNRICAFNFQDKEAQGFFLDIFATYNFPVMFRHTMIEGDHKVVDRRLHQFTDFSAGLRVGYYPIALQVEYRLTDYLIAGYPEMPLLRFGISVLMPSY